MKDCIQKANHVTVINKSIVLSLVIGVIGAANASTDKLQKSKLYLDSLANALMLYKMDTGSYPCGENALRYLVTNLDKNKNWKGPYLNPKVSHLNFTDGWGNQFVYIYKCKSESSEFKLYSYGENGIDNQGTGDDVLYSK